MRQASVPIWYEEKHKWVYRPSINGKQRKFTSSRPGPGGARECIKKYSIVLRQETRSGTVRVGQAWEEYLEDKASRLGKKSESYIKAESFGRLYVLPIVKHKPLPRMSPQDWQDIIYGARKQDGSPLAKKSLANLRAEIHAFCKFCKRKWYIEELPETLEIPRTAPVIGKKIVQREALATFLSDSGSDWYIHLWQFTVVTGLRPGEVYGLRHEDLSDGWLYIGRSINRFGDKTPGKNDNARRQMFVSKTAQYFLQRQAEMLDAAGVESEWIFPDPDGLQLKPNNVRKHWAKYRQQYLGGVTQYGLRHTFNTVTQRLPEAWRKKLLGHSAAMATDRTYLHTFAGEDQDIAAAVDQEFSTFLVPRENQNAQDPTASGVSDGGA